MVSGLGSQMYATFSPAPKNTEGQVRARFQGVVDRTGLDEVKLGTV